MGRRYRQRKGGVRALVDLCAGNFTPDRLDDFAAEMGVM